MDTKRFDPDKLGPRSRAAYNALFLDGELADGTNIWDGGWHSWRAVVEKMLTATDILPRSCCDILRALEYQGEAMRRGTYSAKADHREILFIDTTPPLPREDYASDEEWAEAATKYERVKNLHQEALARARRTAE